MQAMLGLRGQTAVTRRRDRRHKYVFLYTGLNIFYSMLHSSSPHLRTGVPSTEKCPFPHLYDTNFATHKASVVSVIGRKKARTVAQLLEDNGLMAGSLICGD
jgi:hypothetical protein